MNEITLVFINVAAIERNRINLRFVRRLPLEDYTRNTTLISKSRLIVPRFDYSINVLRRKCTNVDPDRFRNDI